MLIFYFLTGQFQLARRYTSTGIITSAHYRFLGTLAVTLILESFPLIQFSGATATFFMYPGCSNPKYMLTRLVHVSCFICLMLDMSHPWPWDSWTRHLLWYYLMSCWFYSQILCALFSSLCCWCLPRIFDLSSALEQPEQEYYLQPVEPGSSCKAASICPVDFSFGGDHLWDRFSVSIFLFLFFFSWFVVSLYKFNLFWIIIFMVL